MRTENTNTNPRVGETQVNNFGSIMIITGYRKYSDISVYFPDYDYTVEHTTYGRFKDGRIACPYERRTFGMGYMGVGPYTSRENGKATKAYDTWYNIINRCYNPEVHKNRPHYEECYICDEWLNYQTFCSWYYDNYYEVPGETMAIDKDILVKHNKCYSPETCVFVPTAINSLFVKNDSVRGDLPIGVYYHNTKKKYIAQYSVNSKKKQIGTYATAEEAFNGYKEYKEALIKKIADDYIEYIPFELYVAMLDYEVEYDD